MAPAELNGPDQAPPSWTSTRPATGPDPAGGAGTGLGTLDWLASQDAPPLRWVAGAGAVEAVDLAQVHAHRELSSSLAHDDAA